MNKRNKILFYSIALVGFIVSVSIVLAFKSKSTDNNEVENLDNTTEISNCVESLETSSAENLEKQKDTNESKSESNSKNNSKSNNSVNQEKNKDTNKNESTKNLPSTKDSAKSNIIPVNCILQYPELETGCEVTSLTMGLNYLGYNVSKTDMARKYLPKSEDFYTYNNINYGPDFRTTFPGDPFTSLGYGCLAPAIVTTAENYLSQNGHKNEVNVKNISGTSPQKLYDYINQRVPIIVWATIDMDKPETGESWRTPNGETVTWKKHEHCLVLVGYNNQNVTLCDPLVGVTTYSKELFETRYRQMGSQAVVITKS